MNNSIPLILVGVAVVVAVFLLWYLVTRFLVNIGAKEVGIKERQIFWAAYAAGSCRRDRRRGWPAG